MKMGAFLSSSATTISTETGVRYFLFLIFPLPARILRPSLARSRSYPIPIFSKTSTTSEVAFREASSSSTTMGKDTESSNWWPRAFTHSAQAVAARADWRAILSSFLLTFCAQILSGRGG